MKKKILICFVTVFVLLSINVFAGFKLVSSDETKYCGGSDFTDESETISYSRRETDSYNIMGEIPNYYSQASNTNCANLAGTVIIGYYDRYCEELIPNFKAYNQLGSIFKYKIGGSEVQAVTDSLYGLMGTDIGVAGTTYNGFQSGMKSYANSHGYDYITEDLGNLDFSKYKSAVEANKPVALFLNNYSFAMGEQNNGSAVVINSQHCTIAHVVVGYGYKIDTYLNSNGQVVATRTYLKVVLIQ